MINTFMLLGNVLGGVPFGIVVGYGIIELSYRSFKVGHIAPNFKLLKTYRNVNYGSTSAESP
jgi:hypothetical protein